MSVKPKSLIVGYFILISHYILHSQFINFGSPALVVKLSVLFALLPYFTIIVFKKHIQNITFQIH